MVELIEKDKAIPNILLEKRDSTIPVQKSGILSTLDLDDMLKMLNNNEKDKTFKEFYKDESERAFKNINFLDKKISDNPTIPSEKKKN